MESIKPRDSFDGVSNFVLSAIKNGLSDLSTSNMATITAVNKSSIDVKIDSTKEELPELPFFTLQGGGKYLQFPISIGDKCLVIFSKSTVEDWTTGKEDFNFDDTFDNNNGFAFVGINTDLNPITTKDYTDLFVDTIMIRNENEELITLLSETLQLLSDTNQTLSVTTVSGTPIDQQSIFGGYKVNADGIKTRIDTFKV